MAMAKWLGESVMKIGNISLAGANGSS